MLTGYNLAWFYNQFTFGEPTPDIIEQVKAVVPQAQVLRFPGGSSSFMFDLTKNGYGQTGAKHPNYVFAHIRFAKAVGAKTSFVANLYQPLTGGDEAYWIKNIVDTVKILNPEYVELSNELYLYEHLTGVKTGDPRWWESKAKFTASVQASAIRYTTLCAKVIGAIREAGFNPLFGAVMDNAVHTRGRAWNAAVRASLAYDFEVFHYYSTRRTSGEIYNDLQKNFAGGTMPIAVTEYWWDFGYDSSKNPQDAGQSYVEAFEYGMATSCAKDSRVFMRLRHQLVGTNNFSKIKL